MQSVEAASTGLVDRVGGQVDGQVDRDDNTLKVHGMMVVPYFGACTLPASTRGC